MGDDFDDLPPLDGVDSGEDLFAASSAPPSGQLPQMFPEIDVQAPAATLALPGPMVVASTRDGIDAVVARVRASLQSGESPTMKDVLELLQRRDELGHLIPAHPEVRLEDSPPPSLQFLMHETRSERGTPQVTTSGPGSGTLYPCESSAILKTTGSPQDTTLREKLSISFYRSVQTKIGLELPKRSPSSKTDFSDIKPKVSLVTIVAHKGQAQSKRPRPNASSAPGASSSRNLDVEGDASIGGQLTVRGDLKVEGDIIGRVTSPDADVAEWFCRVNVNEPIGAGDVVMLCEGDKISRGPTFDKESPPRDVGYFVVSTRPCLEGGRPHDAVDAGKGNVVALLGQVDVKVSGAAPEGALLVPSGLGDGRAVALPTDVLDDKRRSLAFGRVIGARASPGCVRVLVPGPGLGPDLSLLERVRNLEEARCATDSSALLAETRAEAHTTPYVRLVDGPSVLRRCRLIKAVVLLATILVPAVVLSRDMVVIPLMGALGFTRHGIAKGSWAAGVQRIQSLHHVKLPSWFRLLQSIGSKGHLSGLQQMEAASAVAALLLVHILMCWAVFCCCAAARARGHELRGADECPPGPQPTYMRPANPVHGLATGRASLQNAPDELPGRSV